MWTPGEDLRGQRSLVWFLHLQCLFENYGDVVVLQGSKSAKLNWKSQVRSNLLLPSVYHFSIQSYITNTVESLVRSPRIQILYMYERKGLKRGDKRK